MNFASATSTESLYTSRGWNLTSASQLWHLWTGEALCHMQSSCDPNVLQSLRSRIEEEKNVPRRGLIRPATYTLDDLADFNRVKDILRKQYETNTLQKLKKRAPISSKWWVLPVDPDTAKHFAAAINGIKNYKLSRFAASIMTLTPLPSCAALRRWGISSHSNTTCPIQGCGSKGGGV